MYWLLFNQHYEHRTDQRLCLWANPVFQNHGVCSEEFPSLPSSSPSFLVFWQDNSYCALRNKNVSREDVCLLNGHINLKDFLCWNWSCTCIHWAPLCGMVRPSTQGLQILPMLETFHWAWPFSRPDWLCLILWGWDGSYLECKELSPVYNFRYSVVYECDSVAFVYQVLL